MRKFFTILAVLLTFSSPAYGAELSGAAPAVNGFVGLADQDLDMATFDIDNIGPGGADFSGTADSVILTEGSVGNALLNLDNSDGAFLVYATSEIMIGSASATINVSAIQRASFSGSTGDTIFQATALDGAAADPFTFKTTVIDSTSCTAGGQHSAWTDSGDVEILVLECDGILTASALVDATAAGVATNSGAFPPATCTTGSIFVDTDETDDTNCTTTADNSICSCVATDTWASAT